MAVKGMRSEVAVVQHTNAGDAVFSGTIAGIIGGTLLGSFVMGAAVMSGGDITAPFRLTGATFIGPAALDGGIGLVMYGVLMHLLASIGWGIVFAALLPREATPGAALVAGLIFGLIVMLVMVYVVLPVVNPVMREAVEETTSFTMAHLIYGGSLAVVPVLRHGHAARVE